MRIISGKDFKNLPILLEDDTLFKHCFNINSQLINGKKSDGGDWAYRMEDCDVID